MYYYDTYGYQTAQVLPERSTNIAPPAPANGMVPNWTGVGWVLVAYNAPPAPPAPPANPVDWYIDIGPFMDRFGAAKLAVLTSADITVKAIVQDMMARKWIDLKRTDVASSFAYIGSKVPAVTPAMQTAILTTPVTPEENLALRKLYFS